MPTRSRPLARKDPGAGPVSPDQPIHTPPASRMTGSSALTRPPGLGRQSASPSGPSVRSTGNRLATTTNRWRPAVSPPASASAVSDVFLIGGITSTLCLPQTVLATV